MSGDLGRLRTGALDWLDHHLDHFDPFAAPVRSAARGEADAAARGQAPAAGQGGAGAGAHTRAKAVLELALLCHCGTRAGHGDDPRLDKATALVRTVWQHPDLAAVLGAEPRYAAYYALVCLALAPGGIDDSGCRAVCAPLVADPPAAGDLTAYQCLELRYYADKAGVPHTLGPYRDLAAAGVLVTLPAAAAGRYPAPGEPPVTVPEAYALTHTSFYLSDFAASPAHLPAEGRVDGNADAGSDSDTDSDADGNGNGNVDAGALRAARALVTRLLDFSVRHDWWDLTAELLLTRACLGEDPLAAPGGAAALACLVRAQRPDGSLPGRSPRTAARAADPPDVRFEKAYHTTLVTALMSLVVAPAGAV